MSYTQMNGKFKAMENITANKSIATDRVDNTNNVILIDGTVDWNSSTSAGVYPILDNQGNPIFIPTGAVIGGRESHNLLLKQFGPDVTTSSSNCLRGSATVVLYLTNQINGVYQSEETEGVLTPIAISTSAAATTIGMSGTGYVLEGTIYMTANKPVSANSLQATYLCASVSGPATNSNSKLQVSVRVVL